jgi:hypothetical protein
MLSILYATLLYQWTFLSYEMNFIIGHICNKVNGLIIYIILVLIHSCVSL